jgi:hypothetical protein
MTPKRSRGSGGAPRLDLMRRIAIMVMVVAALAAGTAVAKKADGGASKGDAAATQYGTKDQGCTPGFWKNHTNVWSGYSPSDKFNAVFGVSYNSSLTLGGALRLGGGGFAALARHAAAALLNSEHSGVSYGLTTSEIVALVQQAFGTNNPEPIKNQLDGLNNAGCSIDAHGRPIP